ncbi:GFA family protein [Bdellovibrio sp. HCB337]|uniref:GFA family protein n=1 Tax=Bdellovibrio sp. HCB337 TaxID=3394358 RepID=UPI0039A45B70
MTTPIVKQGTCLCKKVRISISPEKNIFDACHCSMCRRWGGGPALTVEGGKSFHIQGEEFVSIYDSSEWAQRAFCKNCGSHLFYHLKNTQHYNFSLGLFEGVENFKFHVQIFVDSKPAFYDFANKTEMMTEAEVLAKFGATST